MNFLQIACVSLQIILFTAVGDICAHGTVLDPVARQSRWRTDRTALKNYDDNALFCGGFYVQQLNGGKCGLCGDNAADPIPRAHELGGKYGQGVIVSEYKSGGTLPVKVSITANHKGYFEFDLCNLDESKENEACFAKTALKLLDGSGTYELTSTKTGLYEVTLQIPPKFKCAHCVLRWTYTAGNNWGVCQDGKGAVGCGPQEHFIACSDIKIE